jgi:hypothetical protein
MTLSDRSLRSCSFQVPERALEALEREDMCLRGKWDWKVTRESLEIDWEI